MDRRRQVSTAAWRTVNPSKQRRRYSCDSALYPLPDIERTTAPSRRLVIATYVSRNILEETT
jgi:hypothetical protein